MTHRQFGLELGNDSISTHVITVVLNVENRSS